jgi:hypothetical protein
MRSYVAGRTLRNSGAVVAVSGDVIHVERAFSLWGRHGVQGLLQNGGLRRPERAVGELPPSPAAVDVSILDRTVPEVTAYIASVATTTELHALHAAESRGKRRKGVRDAIEERKGELAFPDPNPGLARGGRPELGGEPAVGPEGSVDG